MRWAWQALRVCDNAPRWRCAWLAAVLARARPAPASCGGRCTNPRHTLLIALQRKVWCYRLSFWGCIPAGISPILGSFFPSSPGESVSLLEALLCHFFGRMCVIFGSDFVSLFWTKVCHFWERFCVTFLNESVPLLGALLCHLSGRNFCHFWNEKILPKPTKFRRGMERKSAAPNFRKKELKNSVKKK